MNTTEPGPSAPGTDSLGSPATMDDIVIGALALLLPLAALVIAIVQLYRTTAARSCASDPESAQTDRVIENAHFDPRLCCVQRQRVSRHHDRQVTPVISQSDQELALTHV